MVYGIHVCMYALCISICVSTHTYIYSVCACVYIWNTIRYSAADM